MRYIREPKTREESDVFFKENLELYEKMKGMRRFAVFTKDSHEFAGAFSLLSLDNSTNIHLGYALLKHFHSKGLAKKLVKASLSYVFAIIQKDTVQALTVAENIASQKVMLKSVFLFLM